MVLTTFSAIGFRVRWFGTTGHAGRNDESNISCATTDDTMISMPMASDTLRNESRVIKEAADRAARTATDAKRYPAIVSIVCLLIVGTLMLWQRQDMVLQRDAFLSALQKNTDAITKLSEEVHRHVPSRD